MPALFVTVAINGDRGLILEKFDMGLKLILAFIYFGRALPTLAPIFKLF